jgi:hypothetical protein
LQLVCSLLQANLPLCMVSFGDMILQEQEVQSK